MLGGLAVTTTAISVIVTGLVWATRLVFLTLIGSRCSNRNAHWRRCCFNRSSCCSGRRRSLALGLIFGFTLGFFFGLQASRFRSGALLFEPTLLLGFDLFVAALDEGLLLAHFNADGLAASARRVLVVLRCKVILRGASAFFSPWLLFR